MNNALLVFQERNHYFGFLSNDFERYFPADKAWISPSSHSRYIWNFKEESIPVKGKFIHPGILFDFPRVSFDQSGYIFMKNLPNRSSMGIFMNNFEMQISLKKIANKKLEIDQMKNFPKSYPRSVFKYVQQYKRRNILVIDPLKLFKAYHIPLS